MFGGINFKQLSERFNESLHDLESTLANAATATGSGSQPNTPTRQQPTRSSTSPAASASPSRSRPRPAIDPQARSQSASSSTPTPLSPTSLAQASQSASQLADSALSSLRASLRKGRQSLESAAAARTSLDKSAPGASPAAAVTPAASEKPTPLEEEPDTKEGDTPTVGTFTDSSATSSTPAAVPEKSESTAASESNDAKTAPTVTSPPQELAAPEETVALTVEAAPVVEKNTEEDLLGPLADDPAPTARVAEADKVEPVYTTTTSDDASSSVEPSAAIAASPPTDPLSTKGDKIPPPSLAVSPPAPASHTSPVSLVSPMGYEAPGEEDDADDWGMGSISPAPDSEGFVDPPVQTAAATADLVAIEPAKADELPESAAQPPTALLPNEEAPASVEVSEVKEEEEAASADPSSDSEAAAQPTAGPSLESAAPSQPTAELSETGVDSGVDATTPSMEESAKGPEAIPEEVAAPPSHEEIGSSESSPAVAETTEVDLSATEQLAPVGSDVTDEAAGADEEQAAPEAKVAVTSDNAGTSPPVETADVRDAVQTGDVTEPSTDSESASRPSVPDEAAQTAAPASKTLDSSFPEIAEAPPADLQDETDSPEKPETEQPSDEFAPSEPIPPVAAALTFPEEAKVDVPASAETTELSPEEDPVVPVRPAEEPVATSPILKPEADKLSTDQAVADLATASNSSPDSDAVPESPNQTLTQADEPAEEKAAETTEEKVETPVTVRVHDKVDERAVENSDEQVHETVDETVDETASEKVNEKAEEKTQATSIPEKQDAPEVIVSSAPHPVDAQQDDGEVLHTEPPKLPTGNADQPKSATPTPHADAGKAPPAGLSSGYSFALGRILAAVTPLTDADDLEAVERELRNLKSKADLGMQEITRLTSQLDRRNAAFEELRETHRLEHKSQQNEIDSLREQLAAKDAKLINAEAAAEQTRAEIAKAAEEYDKLKVVAKEEEEKRVKALSLLRALRQKLVKNEKEKEESDKVLEQVRASEAQAQDTIKADRARFDSEIVALRGAQEQQVNKLKQSFERETANLKAHYERELASRKGQAELDTITLRAEHAKELAARDARIQQLETTVRELSTARDTTFEQLQQRQAEVEANASQQEALKTRAAELEYEASEARDRVTALQEELEELRRRRVDAVRDESTTRRLLEEAEERHSARMRDLEARARQLEKDRRETEDEMGRNLQDRLREVERLRAALAKKDVDYAESVQNTQKREKEIEAAQKARFDLEKRLKAVETSLENLREEAARAQQAEAAVKEELSDRLQRATELEARLEEVSTRESTLRSNNKTLRDELRKLQSGMLNSEKQRPAGVGYFSTMSQSSTPGLTRSSASSTSIASMSTIGGGTVSPPLSASSVTSPPASIDGTVRSVNGSGLSATARADGNAEEALSYEYLRNVILQFLEKPEMRSHLVQVLSVILRFTPAEQRRLAAKTATH
ncbi:hypothetical protein JCM8115_000840 [Rhodotorula mucilaginosa]